MTYVEEFQKELVSMLKDKGDIDKIVAWATKMLRQSYRNGMIAGRKAYKPFDRQSGESSSEEKTSKA